MTIGSFGDSPKERLSALADGELDSAESAATCFAWGSDAGLRADWHAWHLIGDVLRSEDLAADPRGDRRLVAAVRLRLESEPVVLAPMPPRVATAARDLGRQARPGRWTAAGAVAAGALLVVGTFAVVRPGEAPAPARLARADAPVVVATAASAGARPQSGEPAPLPIAIVADNKLIRDAQLDRYLEAHKQFAGSSALGVPSAFLRSATVDSASR
jgi:sigma-E factor negative regulatory protein RseA